MDTIQLSNDVFAGMCVAITILASVCAFIFMDLRRERMRRASTEAAYASINGTLSEVKQEEKYWRDAFAKLTIEKDELNKAVIDANEHMAKEIKRQERRMAKARRLSDVVLKEA
jgi:predicted  nucleic acid-binding Zn-ribbon protein